ncbi:MULTISPECIES: MaoC family dehydratase [Alteromonas]|jgi:hypothetical protein|uniref:Dehydratase n=1 Tax=Alteromonas stellipolaris TaxID=233316 RepID=A0AAW7Z592_9ALTE|nr:MULTISPECIES: MaoC/PaaZ C-terminal domain-containing protein [Alteromonas]AMJ91305.1 dehydratase [Alteromonas sp. Mac2]ALM89898.1 Acyl dehydratase [Alteromonas stellipolaris LMG 21856]AMJ75038.1 dehydratase [Alteromonas stellipolaris]AMJ87443.1 dehydratase [Alteromonas sp. Mac1]ANB21850.1 hypothetical protein A6K25_11530 [Alteromonas stellipolaris]
MFREYAKALFKRVDTRQLMQFKPPTLPPRIYTKQINIDNKHYGAFCQEVAWPDAATMHPLYLQMLSLPLQMQCLLDKKSPFPLLGLIHAANRVEVLEECDLSETFECRVRFSDVRPHSRGWEVDVSLDAFQQGRCVYKAISSYLVKVKAVHVAPRASVQDTTETCVESPRNLLAEFDVTADTGRRYAKISGDYNPIHLFGLSAKAFGFKRPIAHGMWTLARALSFVPVSEGQHISDVVCRFRRPVMLPCSINIYQMCRDEDRSILEITSSDDQQVHLDAEVSTL